MGVSLSAAEEKLRAGHLSGCLEEVQAAADGHELRRI